VGGQLIREAEPARHIGRHSRNVGGQHKVDSMRYVEVQPSPALRNYLECFWFVSDDRQTVVTGVPERVLPDGCVEWIFHFGEPFQQSIGAVCWERQPRSFLVGELTEFLLLRSTGATSVMGVRFRPGSAYRFLPLPLELLTDKTVGVEEVWGAEGRRLEKAVFAASSNQHRRKLLEAFLLRKLEESCQRPRFEAAIREIMRNCGRTRVDELARRLGCSPRQVEREFRLYLGLTPKALARIIRFQNLLRLVGEETLERWANLALASGYCDQSHMVREFQSFTGHCPSDQPAADESPLARHFVSPRRLRALLGGSHTT